MKPSNSRLLIGLFFAASLPAAAGCSGGPADGSLAEAPLDRSPAGELTVVTAEGRAYGGATARIQIRAGLPGGAPAVAEISFAASTPDGESIGLHAELDPRALLGERFRVALDGIRPTRPGLGVLSHGRGVPESARTGSLEATVGSGQIRGSFTSDAPALSSSTFEGRLVVECLTPGEAIGVPPEDAQGSVGASISGAYVLVADERFESDFCAPYAALQR